MRLEILKTLINVFEQINLFSILKNKYIVKSRDYKHAFNMSKWVRLNFTLYYAMIAEEWKQNSRVNVNKTVCLI